jgi:hypothetical protein
VSAIFPFRHEHKVSQCLRPSHAVETDAVQQYTQAWRTLRGVISSPVLHLAKRPCHPKDEARPFRFCRHLHKTAPYLIIMGSSPNLRCIRGPRLGEVRHERGATSHNTTKRYTPETILCQPCARGPKQPDVMDNAVRGLAASVKVLRYMSKT